jgi:hypothetical protein
MKKIIPQSRQKPVPAPTHAELEKENKPDTKKYKSQMKAAEGKQRPRS